MQVPIKYFIALALLVWVFCVNLFAHNDSSLHPPPLLDKNLSTKPPVVIPLPDDDLALPDFHDYAPGSERKDAFFNYLMPIIKHANSIIRLERFQLLQIAADIKARKLLTDKKKRTLKQLIKKYNVEETELADQINRLLNRVDIVPVSLALAQAANESAYGTSRFAKEANNLFGQWCFVEGCGIVPLMRGDEQVHEVKSFASTVESVKSYLRNLNSNDAYKPLRDLRRMARSKGSLNGLTVVEGLELYSARGQDYVEELAAMIRYNNLQRFDEHK